MNAPRRLILMFTLTAALVGCGLAANYLLNPYGAWSAALINPIFRKVKHERVVTPYLLRTARPHTLLVGSSRVLMGMRIEQGERGGVMNAAITAAKLPELSRIVALALDNPQLKRIVWGVDFFAFDENHDQVAPEFDRRIAGRRTAMLEDALSLSALQEGYEFLRRARRGAAKLPPTATAAIPWPMPLVCEDFHATRQRGLSVTGRAEIEAQLSRDLPEYQRYRFSPRLLKLFHDTVGAARTRGVEVILFVPPMSEYELELLRQGGQWETFQNWKRGLAASGPFWDFSGYNGIARDDGLFMHVMHFKIAAGQMMLRIMLGEPAQPCDGPSKIIAENARYVEPSAIDREIAIQDRMREAALGRDDARYARIAADAIARRARERGPGPFGSAASVGSGAAETASLH